MKPIRIKLTTVDDVKNFINTVSNMECDIDLASGKYVIDAKSIMGIFSLDLSKVLELSLHIKEGKQADEYIERLKKFEV